MKIISNRFSNIVFLKNKRMFLIGSKYVSGSYGIEPVSCKKIMLCLRYLEKTLREKDLKEYGNRPIIKMDPFKI